LEYASDSARQKTTSSFTCAAIAVPSRFNESKVELILAYTEEFLYRFLDTRVAC
jgi:hypothetical protein